MNNIILGDIETRPLEPDTVWRLGNLSPYIRQSGDDIRHRWAMGERKLLDYLAVYIGSGYGVFSVSGHSFEVAEDDLIWIPPDTPHAMTGTSKEMHCIYLHFDLLYDPERSHWNAWIPAGMMDLARYTARMHPPLIDPVISQWEGRIINCNNPNIKALFRKICHIHKNFPWQRVIQAGLFLQMLEEIIILTTKHAEQNNPHAITMQQAVTYLQKHLEGKIDVDAMALSFKMSASYFRKMFKTAYGISPRTMHRELQMWKACEMLAYSGLNVSEVADKLGFSNVQNFSRAFKEVTSNTPLSYRNK